MTQTVEALSRRRLVTAGGGVAAAAVLAGCSRTPAPSNVPLERGSPGARDDVALLGTLLAAERYAIAAYAAGMPLLGREAARAGKQFLAQELAHAEELQGLIKQAGAKPPLAPASYDLGSPRGEREVFGLLHRAERGQLAAYGHAIPRLRPARLRAAAAAILANHAQHIAVVRSALGLAPIPAAFVAAE